MKRRIIACVTAGAMALGGSFLAVAGPMVIVQQGEQVIEMSLDSYPQMSGIVAYQGPVLGEGQEAWKDSHAYTGVRINEMLAEVGGMNEGDRLAVVAVDGYYKELPYEVIYRETVSGTPILAVDMDGVAAVEWEDAPMLVFLPDDGRFSNADMLQAFGEDLAHYYAGSPSTTGFLVKNVGYLIVNYDGGMLPAQTTETVDTSSSTEEILTVVKGEDVSTYSIAELEALYTITAPGTFVDSIGGDHTATYTGVPICSLVGDIAPDATIRVIASDGYSMNYAADLLADRSTGTWIVAFKENGVYMPYDPGYLRVVKVGEDNPRFDGSLSARMVEQINILGAYEEYSLLLQGAITRTFSRAELEAGVGCPCHTSTVTVTGEGGTHTYTGLPLWRLIAYVDDENSPFPEQGIYYDDTDLNDDLAEDGYTITLVAGDGYSQSVSSTLVAHDDRFIVALKQDGVFLDPIEDGHMRFVVDDSVLFPKGTQLKSVKWLVEIHLDL